MTLDLVARCRSLSTEELARPRESLASFSFLSPSFLKEQPERGICCRVLVR